MHISICIHKMLIPAGLFPIKKVNYLTKTSLLPRMKAAEGDMQIHFSWLGRADIFPLGSFGKFAEFRGNVFNIWTLVLILLVNL